jgi:uncharacterized protein (TIGR02246 family)
MKRILAGVMVCWVLCMPAALRAQEAAARPPEADAAVHDALRALKNDMEQALNARDLDRLLSHVTPDVVFTTMNNDVSVGKDALRAYYTRMLTGPERKVEALTAKFEVDDLTRLYGDTGLAQGSSTDRYALRDGSDLLIHGRWSCTLVKRDGQWLIASFHYSTNVFDNPVLEQVKKKAVQMAGVGGGVLLLLGLVMGALMARPRARR